MAVFTLLSQDIIQDVEEKNVDTILAYASNINKNREKKSNILLTPELSLQGFPDTFDKLQQSANPAKQETIEKIKTAAVKHQLFIGFGYFESYRQRVFNTYSIAGPEGTLIATQRKRKTFKYANEHLFVKAAQETNDFLFQGLKTRIVICFSLRFPELFSSKSEQPQLYIVPANWPEKRIDHWEALLIARAIEKQAWVIGINRSGGIYNGHSLVINPNGIIVVRNNESLAGFTIDKETVTQLRETFPLS